MERNQVVALIVVVVAISALVIVAVWYPTTLPQVDVRIGFLNQDLHQLALKVALANGWFEEEGLVVDTVQYGNGALEMDGFLGGQIDMGYLGAAPAMTKRLNQEIMITILAAVNLEGSAIMVLKSEYDSGAITNVSGLTGKMVMHPGPSTVQNFLLRLALNQSDMSYTDIQPKLTSPPYMEASLSTEMPAFIAWEPFCAKAEYNNVAVPLILSGDIWSRHPCCVVAASNSFLSSHPDIVQKVIDIHKRAEAWIVNNPDSAIDVAIEWLEMDETPVENAFNRIIFDYNLNRTGLEAYLRFLIDQEIVSLPLTEVDTFLDGFINETFVADI